MYYILGARPGRVTMKQQDWKTGDIRYRRATAGDGMKLGYEELSLLSYSLTKINRVANVIAWRVRGE